MTWKRYDDSGQRWTWTGDEERHLLLLHGGELREYHEVPGGAPTVHVYVPNPLVLVHDAPLESAQHRRTTTVGAQYAPWVRTLDDRELFEWLEFEHYDGATG